MGCIQQHRQGISSYTEPPMPVVIFGTTLSHNCAMNTRPAAKVGWMKFAGGNWYKGEKFVSGQVKYECGKWYAYLCYEVEVAGLPDL